eukprot:6185288-Pleurochrysis_carterae.AAC.2
MHACACALPCGGARLLCWLGGGRAFVPGSLRKRCCCAWPSSTPAQRSSVNAQQPSIRLVSNTQSNSGTSLRNRQFQAERTSSKKAATGRGYGTRLPGSCWRSCGGTSSPLDPIPDQDRQQSTERL